MFLLLVFGGLAYDQVEVVGALTLSVKWKGSLCRGAKLFTGEFSSQVIVFFVQIFHSGLAIFDDHLILGQLFFQEVNGPFVSVACSARNTTFSPAVNLHLDHRL